MIKATPVEPLSFILIPERQALILKAGFSVIVTGLIGLSSWLAFTIGLHPITALLAAAPIMRASLFLMPQTAAKMAHPEAGYLREGRATVRLHRALVVISTAALLVLIIALWIKFLPAIGIHDATLKAFATSAFGVVPILFSQTLQIRFVRAARPAPRHNLTFTRGSTIAVVIIHGIGSKKPGGPLRSIAGPIEQFLYRQAPGNVRAVHYLSKEDMPEHVEFLYEATIGRGNLRSTQRVVMLEALWANTEHRTRGIRSLIWIARSLPLLMLIVVAPDNRDLRNTSISRMAYRLTFISLILLSVLQPAIRIWALGVLIVLALTAIFRRTNLVGDVQMAAVNDAAVATIVDDINTTIDQALSIAKKVIIIAHSQGGYLSHLALRARKASGKSHENIELIGVGSGLKPIWLLRKFGDWRSFGIATLLLLGLGATFVSLIPIGLGLLEYLTSWIREWAQPAMRSLIVAPSISQVHPVHFDWHVMLPWSWRYPLSPVPDFGQLIVLAIGLLLFLFGWWRALPKFRALQDNDLTRPRALSGWTEITSSVDSVGRLAFPRLQGVEIIEAPGLGNPLVDHISYFRLSSPVTWLLASQVFRGVVQRQLPTLREWAHYLYFRSWRVKDFSTTLGMLVIAIYAFDRLNPAVRGIRALGTQLHHPGWVFATLLGIAVIGPITGTLDRFRMSRAMAVYPLESPPTLKVHSSFGRMTLFMTWLLVAVLVGASTHFLVRYPAMSATELRLLPIAPLVTSFLLLVIAAALSAGYRPSIWIWAFGLATLLYWASYLPGRGDALLFYLSLIVFSATICTAILYRRYGYTLLLPNSSWPGDHEYLMSKATRAGGRDR